MNIIQKLFMKVLIIGLLCPSANAAVSAHSTDSKKPITTIIHNPEQKTEVKPYITGAQAELLALKLEFLEYIKMPYEVRIGLVVKHITMKQWFRCALQIKKTLLWRNMLDAIRKHINTHNKNSPHKVAVLGAELKNPTTLLNHYQGTITKTMNHDFRRDTKLKRLEDCYYNFAHILKNATDHVLPLCSIDPKNIRLFYDPTTKYGTSMKVHGQTITFYLLDLAPIQYQSKAKDMLCSILAHEASHIVHRDTELVYVLLAWSIEYFKSNNLDAVSDLRSKINQTLFKSLFSLGELAEIRSDIDSCLWTPQYIPGMKKYFNLFMDHYSAKSVCCPRKDVHQPNALRHRSAIIVEQGMALDEKLSPSLLQSSLYFPNNYELNELCTIFFDRYSTTTPLFKTMSNKIDKERAITIFRAIL